MIYTCPLRFCVIFTDAIMERRCYKGGLRVMDEMKISSKFTRMLLSKLAKGVLHKKLGYNVDIQLNELNASISDEKAHVHVSIDAYMSKEELMKILKKIGLN